MQSVLGPLANAAEYLTLETMCHYASWLMIRTLWLINNLTSEDFDPQESRVFDLITSLRVLCYRFSSFSNHSSSAEAAFPFSLTDFSQPLQPDWDALMEKCPSIPSTITFLSVARVDEYHLTVLLSSLCPPVGVASSFKVRMLAIRHLIDQLSAAQQTRSSANQVKSGANPVITSTSILAAENQAFLHRRKVHRLIRYDALMTWVREKSVVQSIMSKCHYFNCLLFCYLAILWGYYLLEHTHYCISYIIYCEINI